MEEQNHCPKFDPAPWNEKTFEWKDKKFIKDKVFTFFYMPINFGSVVKKMMAKIAKAGAETPDCMGLSDHTSKWNMDLYIAVDKEIPDAENTEISGHFLSKVYEGPFKDTGKWCEDFEVYAAGENLKISKLYMWYTTCPKCAEVYGRNYVVIIGKTEV